MASRHDIIHIDFQANAGKANVALQALQSEAEKARLKVEGLRAQLQNAKATNMPIADIQKLENELKLASKESKQWQQALQNNMKGVRALDEAIKMFNKGKGTVEDMNAALSKTALNAAQLQKSRSADGSKQWKEMDALIVALQQNIAKCNTATNQLVSTIKSGGTASIDTLTKAKTDLQQMIALEERGSNAWKKYSSQLKVVEGELARLAAEETRMAGQNALAKVFSGQYVTKTTAEIENLISAIKQYQGSIADPEGKGARHFRATETALQKLSEQLGKTKGDIVNVQQALKVAGAAGVANQFGSSGLAAQQQKLTDAYIKTSQALTQLKQERAVYTQMQQQGMGFTLEEIYRMQELDTVIATTTTQLNNERNAMNQANEANNLTNKSITQSIEVLRQQQQTVAEGSVKWKQYDAAIAELEERQKIMRGEAMALTDAMKLASTAGKQGFSGTAKELQLAQQAIEKAAASAKKGTPEWQKYQKALAQVRVEMNNAGITSERMQSILNRPTNAKNLQELQAAVKRAKAELDLMAGTVGKTSKAYADMAAKTKAAEQQLKVLQAQSHGTATAFDKAWSRLKTYITLYMGAAVAIQKLVAAFGDLMTLSDKLGEVRKTTGFTADEVGRLSDRLRELDTRTDLATLMGTAAKAGQLGLKTMEDVRGFTEAANMLMVALPEMGEEAATQMMKVATATGEVAKIQKEMDEGLVEGSSAVAVAMTKIGSTIDQLRANSAAAAPAITDFVKRVGAVGAQSGISIDQVAALGSTVDALGMRVEMSATALSRMLPAIKNNAFSIAKSIGVTPETIRELFETGRGMEAILMIFQHIKDSGKDADSIEQMLGMNGMADIMKELNQQGARAGIVFAGLSQNVDTLREHLGIAKTAYEENVAIMNEYNKMNDTTAAKWAKLKNEIEETFVSDAWQRRLGGIIDFLRAFVNILTGRVAPALDFIGILLKTLLIRWALVKTGIGEALLITLPKALMSFKATATLAFSTIGTQIKAATFYLGLHTMATKRAAVEMRKMNAAQMANFWMALGVAILYAAKALYDWYQRLNKTVGALAEAEANLTATTREAGNLFSRFKQLNDKQQELSRTTKSLKDREEELKKELEELRNKLGDGAEQSEVFKKKQEELSKAHEEVAKAEGKASDATNRRLGLINEINSKYSTYLGYMLSEASTAETVASAHDLIIAALKEEMYWREKNNAFKTVTEQHGDDLKKYREKSLSEMEDDKVDDMRQQNIMTAWQEQLSQVQYDASKGGFTLTPGGKAYATIDQALEGMKERFNTVLATEGGYYMVHTDDKQSRLNDWWGGGLDDGFKDWTKESLKVLKEASMMQSMAGGAATKAHEQSVQRARENTNALINQAQEGGASNKQVAEAIVGIQKNLSKYGELAGDYSQFAKDTSLKGIANVLLKDMPAKTREAVEKEMERVAANGITPPKPTPTKNPWGATPSAESTEYKDMSAETLVNRRKQMKEFVNAIQTDTDVQAVLKEDAALKKAIEKGMSSDMRTVIEWYNTERLKIQDELHARHLTNTGDWMDPKKQKGAHKQFQNEMQAYLDEIDAYYTERKAKIQEAQNDEQISEAEAKNRTLANDAEWRQRRAELQQLYAEKSAKVTQAEQDAIYNIISERTGDSEAFVKSMIQKTIGFAKQIEASGEKGAAVVHKWRSKLDKDTEADFLRQRNAIGQHMKAITDIVNKENPYTGITEELRKNLATMDVLLADVTDKEQRTVDKEIERTMFILEESAKGYGLTWEQMMSDMAKRGWKAWADAIEADPQMQDRLMKQTYRVFEKVQDAIKKEASELKKQADIMWSNILLPGGDGKTTIKDAFEQAIGRLGIEEGRVSRANSLIGAGQASERVADRLAIQQMKVQLAMQRYQYNLVHKIGQEKIDMLRREADAAEKLGNLEEARAKRMQAQNAEMALNLATRKEQTEELKQQEDIIARTEESQARLYKELREWGDLIASSLQSVMEASNAGNAEYYNELAKLNLTGKGGPGAGTYIVIDNEGTEDATAHYEYLDERAALERQREIEQQNAVAEAWKKVMDDINMKLSETITDQLNAMLQNQSIDANTQATLKNTEALMAATAAMGGNANGNANGNGNVNGNGNGTTNEGGLNGNGNGNGNVNGNGTTNEGGGTSPFLPGQEGGFTFAYEQQAAAAEASAERQVAAIDKVKVALDDQFHKQVQDSKTTNNTMANSTQAAYSKMAAACNMYGLAYQTMSNDNLDTTQKFLAFSLQAVGQMAIGMLTTDMYKTDAEGNLKLPGILGEAASQLGPIAGPIAFAAMTALLGGLMGMAMSKVTSAKSQIAQVTGASVGAGRLSTGMLTYAEGNVNEFTDPASLTPGRSYNVDAADGKTYRARYMGANPKTHLTNGPEFHLVGEKGREAIIDAHTTRLLQTDDTGIWKSIQTLYNGGSLRHASVRRGRGVRAFASGNLDEIEDLVGSDGIAADGAGFGGEQMAAFQSSLDRNNELLERALTDGIHARFDVYGKGGLIDSYDTGKKTVKRHGERY